MRATPPHPLRVFMQQRPLPRCPGTGSQSRAGGRRGPDTARLCAADRVQAHSDEPASDRGTRGDGAGRRGQPRARAGPDRASRPGGPEAPLLFLEIRDLIFWGAVHPASDGEYEEVQRVRHVLRRR